MGETGLNVRHTVVLVLLHAKQEMFAQSSDDVLQGTSTCNHNLSVLLVLRITLLQVLYEYIIPQLNRNVHQLKLNENER